MAYADKYHVFYDSGVQWATDNLAALSSFQADRVALGKQIRNAFNREGFIETVFRASRIYHLCQQNPNLAEDKFVAGVCDTICGTQSMP